MMALYILIHAKFYDRNMGMGNEQKTHTEKDGLVRYEV